MDCIAGPQIVPRTISILEATWGSGGASSTVDATQQVRDICGENSTRCQGRRWPTSSATRIPIPRCCASVFTCNGQTTPGQQSMENGVVDLRCERNADLGY